MTAGGGKYYCVVLFILLAVLPGCDRQTRYTLLTTFFTGVPPYEEYYADDRETSAGEDSTSVKEPEAPQYSHAFFAEGKCDICHTMPQDRLPPPADRNQTADFDTQRQERLLSAPLRIGAEKLCLECHTDKSARQAIRNRLVLHSPVAQGNCTGCHATHNSAHKALLSKEPAQLCTACHAPDKAVLPAACFATPPGYDTKEVHCLVCHNPHMGANKSLLTRDHAEVKSVTVKRSISGEK
jgi:predicted CXXCH cytochrome family protein